MVTGLHWEQERWKSDYGYYQTHTPHTPVCLFIFSFARSVNQPFCKETPCSAFTLSMLLSLEKRGWQSGKSNTGAIIQAKGDFSGELQGQGGRVKDISLLAFTHPAFDFLFVPFTQG